MDEVDEVVIELGTNRSALMREALKNLLRQKKLKLLEEQHRAGYAKQPLTAEEFDIWQDEQIWETADE